MKTAEAHQEPGDTRGDRTRRLIKAAIARLAARKDVADITLADICKAAKLTTGAVYFHFKGKDEAVEEMICDAIRDIYREVHDQPDAPFEQTVARVLESSTRFHQTRKRLPKAIQAVINARPGAYQVWLECRRPIIARLERAIVEARTAAGLSAEPAAYLAHFILNSIEDLSMDAFQWSNPSLAAFSNSAELWNTRQSALWAWAILAPMPVPPDHA